MALDRTWYNTLVDETGANDGTIWDKAAVDALMDDVDAEIARLDADIAGAGGSGAVNPSVCDGRLTLTTGVPVTTADVSAATNLYFTPYVGNQIALYDGAAWTLLTFTQITISLAGLTASKPYDIFAYDSSGTVTIETLVWTNDTTRATALTRQDGVLVKTGATTRRFLGSVYINATGGQTDSTFAKRYVSNYYNRVPLPMRVLESANSWTYSGTMQQVNANTANQLDFIVCWQELALVAEAAHLGTHSAAGQDMWTAIGEDSTSVVATGCTIGRATAPVANYNVTIKAALFTYPAVGRHKYVWLEGTSNATATFYGDGNVPATMQNGISGMIDG